jgi:4-amino-4-deoxy-L-arabinose transferase-like glycosyltransferase
MNPPDSSNPSRAASFILLVVSLLAFLPGLVSLPVIDRDEARFAQASRQMFESVALPIAQRDPHLHSARLIVPMVQDRPRLNKPPLIYWLQSASAALFTLGLPKRDAIWMYRVPSLLAAIASVFLTHRLARAMFKSQPLALTAALALAASPVIAWEAHQARSDMVLLAFTLLAMRALWPIASRALPPSSPHDHDALARTPAASRDRWLWPLTFWIAISLATLTKGPITLMIAALTILTLAILTRRWRWILSLRPVLGLLILIASIAPWLYAVAAHVGFNRYLSIIRDEILGRSLEPKEGHWGPPGYHIVLLTVIAWPIAMLLGVAIPAAIRSAFTRDTASSSPLPSSRVARIRRAILSARIARLDLAFALAWLIPAWVVFELVSTKLPHYTMPLLPAAAILASWGALSATQRLIPAVDSRMTRLGLHVWLLLGIAFIIATIALLSDHVRSSLSISWQLPAIAVGVLASVALLSRVISSIHRGSYSRAMNAAAIALLPLDLALFQFLLPNPLALSTRAAAQLETLDPAHSRPLAMLTYHEDSMIFLTRARIQRIDADQLAPWLDHHPDALVLAPRATISAIRAAPSSPLPALVAVGESSGLQYSRGKHVDLAWYQLAPQSLPAPAP